MAFNLQEQEQIDELKSFWASYGNAIMAAITVVLFAFAGVRGYAANLIDGATALAPMLT